MNDEQLKKMSCLDKERQLRDMINSCMCYGDDIHTSDYVQKFRKDFTQKKFDEIVKSQEEYFEQHAKIKENVYTDGEGVTYNSIEWI